VSDGVADLEQAAEQLYGAELADFVEMRKRLAKELRDAGNRADADALAKLRKPSVAAWTLNQLARRQRRDVDLLLDAGHRLREAQAGVLQGSEKESFDQSRKTERDALQRLMREAESLLAGHGKASANVLNQVRESLRTAAISTTGRELLARGRFIEPSRAEGFDIVSELAGDVPRTRPESRPAPDRQADAEARTAVREAKERLREAETRARRSAKAADALQAEADEARAVAEAESAEIEAARRQVDEAERALAARRRGTT
jgi:hypothetical protein